VIGLVIFDCDGVLVDSERLSIGVDVEILGELGWRLTEAEIVGRFVGSSDAFFRREVEAFLGRPLPPDWEAQVEERYRTVFTAHLRPVDGIVEALDRITQRSCVASSGTHEKIRFTLSLTGLWPRFAGRIFSATEVAEGKPAPDLFLHAAARMSVPPSACVVVEDSAFGVQAARAAGMRVLAYGNGVTPPQRLTGPGTIVFEDMRELPALLASLEGRA
jgi:HAD superfamily hydrolase (TIGR01509 family)